jgi:hypothetical protein
VFSENSPPPIVESGFNGKALGHRQHICTDKNEHLKTGFTCQVKY